MQLQTMSNSIFIKNLIFAINESLEYSETNSVMEVTFQKAIGFTQYNFEGEKLKLKDRLEGVNKPCWTRRSCIDIRKPIE